MALLHKYNILWNSIGTYTGLLLNCYNMCSTTKNEYLTDLALLFYCWTRGGNQCYKYKYSLLILCISVKTCHIRYPQSTQRLTVLTWLTKI